MFKKLIAAMLILGFASAVPVMAQGAKIPAIYKADLSSKEATVRTFMLAAYHNKAEILWECFSPSTQKQFEQLVKKQNRSLQEMKKLFCQEMHTSLKKNFQENTKEILIRWLKIPSRMPPFPKSMGNGISISSNN